MSRPLDASEPSSARSGRGDDDLSSLEGTVDRFVFQNEDNGWSVAKLMIRRRKEPVTAVGTLLGIRPGETLRMKGRWVRDPRFGEQFRVDSYVTMKPATLVGIRKYLASGLIPGIGEVMAERIVEKFGLETLEILQHQTARLAEIDGIGPKRVDTIREAWAEQNQIQEVVIFLQTHGVSTNYSVKIFKQYGSRAIARVQQNPYCLAADIPGIGFQTADQIAANLGLRPDAPQRIQAGVLHTLDQMSQAGNVYAPRELLERKTAETLALVGAEVTVEDGGEPHKITPAIAADLIGRGVDELGRAARVVIDEVAGEPAVYLEALYLCETHSAERLRELVETPARTVRIDTERAIRWYEEQAGHQLGEEQRRAFAETVRSKVVVITGGPGTGKTTLVNAIIRVFEKKVQKVELAAPTGRAARRMSEATGREARTIHRLLEFNPRTVSFGRDQDTPIEAELVIVDEVSMVDQVLFHQLVDAIPLNGRLILVGDVDQLPSVGPGRVLHDVIESGRVPVVRLTEIYRQAGESLIVVNAHRIHHGDMPYLRPEADTGDFFFHESEEPEDALSVIKRLVSERIPERFGLRSIEDIQVITPMHKGVLGSVRLNQELQSLLNPHGASVARGDRVFRIGDKVMQIHNDYDKDVFNGDIGRVALIDEEERKISVAFDGRPVVYDFGDLDDLVHAYACSIHKSQGSEFPAVVIPLHTEHFVMLKRNLIYTAITRGKRLVVVVGSRRALALSVRNERDQPRHSALAWRLAEGAGEKPHVESV